MSRIKLLTSQMDNRYDIEHWFVPLTQALQGLSAEQAAWKPNAGVHSIWALVNHLTFWNDHELRRLRGDNDPADAIDNDSTFEPGNGDESAWQQALVALHTVDADLRAVVAAMADADLDQVRGLNGTPWDESLGDLVMHDAHHTGQILYIRKLQGSWPLQRQ